MDHLDKTAYRLRSYVKKTQLRVYHGFTYILGSRIQTYSSVNDCISDMVSIAANISTEHESQEHYNNSDSAKLYQFACNEWDHRDKRCKTFHFTYYCINDHAWEVVGPSGRSVYLLQMLNNIVRCLTPLAKTFDSFRFKTPIPY